MNRAEVVGCEACGRMAGRRNGRYNLTWPQPRDPDNSTRTVTRRSRLDVQPARRIYTHGPRSQHQPTLFFYARKINQFIYSGYNVSFVSGRALNCHIFRSGFSSGLGKKNISVSFSLFVPINITFSLVFNFWLHVIHFYPLMPVMRNFH